MDTNKNYTSKELQEYFINQGYHPTCFKGEDRGFYNPRNRQTILVNDQECSFSKRDIMTLFEKSTAIDRSAELEWRKFQSFFHAYKNKMLGRNYRDTPQEELDAFVKKHNDDPNQRCKIISIETIRIYRKHKYE